MSEKFKTQSWISIHGIGMDLKEHLPAGICMPSTPDFISLARVGAIPATKTATGGWLVHKNDIPEIADIVVRMRGKRV
jgi:hypothetical protein